MAQTEPEAPGEFTTPTAEPAYRCATCGSPDVEDTAWVHMNSDEIISQGRDGPSSDIWCPVCETHSTPIHEPNYCQHPKCVVCAAQEEGTSAKPE